MGENAVERHFGGTGGTIALLAGFFAGPASWFTHLLVVYNLERYACFSGSVWLLHAASVVFLLLAASGGLLSWHSWRRLGEPERTRGAGTLGRSRFLALGGLVLSSFFFWIILMSWMPTFFLDPCTTQL